MDILSELQKLASVANGFTAIAFIVASWALRKFVADVQVLTECVRYLERDVAILMHDSGRETSRAIEIFNKASESQKRTHRAKDRQ